MTRFMSLDGVSLDSVVIPFKQALLPKESWSVSRALSSHRYMTWSLITWRTKC